MPDPNASSDESIEGKSNETRKESVESSVDNDFQREFDRVHPPSNDSIESLIVNEAHRLENEASKGTDQRATNLPQTENDTPPLFRTIQQNRNLTTRQLVIRNAVVGVPTVVIGGLFINAVQAFAAGLQAQPPVVVLDPFMGGVGILGTFGGLAVWSTVAIPLFERLIGRSHDKSD